MTRPSVSTSVGNDFILPKRESQRLKIAVNAIEDEQYVVQTTFAAPVPALTMTPSSFIGAIDNRLLKPDLGALPKMLFELFHRYTIIAFAILLLLIGSSGVTLAGNYEATRVVNNTKPLAALPVKAPSIAGLNSTIPADQMEAKLNTITAQPATLAVGDQTEPISPATIKSWLLITTNKTKTESYVHISATTISRSLTELANKHVKAPVDQVTATHPDGSSLIIVIGKNGAKLTDPSTLATQSIQIAKTLMDAKGLQASTPLETVPFQAVTPAAFAKLLEVNVNTKQMWAWENGTVAQTFLISAGAPKTSTPLGQYKIFSKLAVQDMKGFNADGTKYFQPHVRWINYFLPGGYAVHGNYWRTPGTFGTANTSHGCVSLPDDQAKWVYDFAPLGTTVITHG